MIKRVPGLVQGLECIFYFQEAGVMTVTTRRRVSSVVMKVGPVLWPRLASRGVV